MYLKSFVDITVHFLQLISINSSRIFFNECSKLFINLNIIAEDYAKKYAIVRLQNIINIFDAEIMINILLQIMIIYNIIFLIVYNHEKLTMLVIR